MLQSKQNSFCDHNTQIFCVNTFCTQSRKASACHILNKSCHALGRYGSLYCRTDIQESPQAYLMEANIIRSSPCTFPQQWKKKLIYNLKKYHIKYPCLPLNHFRIVKYKWPVSLRLGSVVYSQCGEVSNHIYLVRKKISHHRLMSVPQEHTKLHVSLMATMNRSQWTGQ